MSIDEIDFRYWFQLFLNDSIKLYLPSGPPPFSRMVEKNIAHLAIKRCFFHLQKKLKQRPQPLQKKPVEIITYKANNSTGYFSY